MLTEHDSHVENSGTAAAVEYCPNITVSGALAGEVDMTSAECGHCADSDDGCHGGDSYLTTPPVLACTPTAGPAPDCLGWINYKAYEISRGQSINYPHSTHRHQGHWANVPWDSHITKRLIFLRAVSGSAGKWIGG